MATNKQATIRYQTLNRCFSNPGRRYYMEDLIEECNKAIYEFTGKEIEIKRRQVFEDIKFMESPQGWNIPLERIRDGHKVYYRYEDRKFSINNHPLNETESKQLKEALETLSRFKGLPQFEWVAEITARIDSELGLTKENKHVIEFDQNYYLKGLEFISPIYNAIVHNRTLKLGYKSFKQNIKQHFIIHPYFLKQYNNRWFVFGLNDASDRIINLALDRIVELEEDKIKYRPNTIVDFREYFEDVIGVSVNSNTEAINIVLSVDKTLFPYIETKPIHGSQKIKERQKEKTILSIDVIPNYELEAAILSFGEGIEIIEPAELRKKFTERVKALSKKYK